MAQPPVVYTGPGIDVTREAAADLTAKQFYIVKLDTAGKVVLASFAGEAVFGVLQNAPNTGEAALVRTLGVSKVKSGAAFTNAGVNVQTTAAGKADVATTGDFSVGRILVTAADGDVAMMYVNPNDVALA